MSLTSFLSKILNGTKTNPDGSREITIKAFRDDLVNLQIETFSTLCAINLIARSISKCEFRTFLGGKETFGDEYWLWNYSPNRNQNSTQFLQELILKLCRFNEALVVEYNGQLIIADGYQRREYALVDDIFEQVSRGQFTFTKQFYASDVLHFRLHDENIRQYMHGMFAKYDALMNSAAKQYEDKEGRKVLLNIDAMARGDPKFEETFHNVVNNQLKPFFEAKSAALPLFDGWSAEFPPAKNTTNREITDLKELTNQAMDRAAQAFGIPPSLLRGDIADVSNLTQNLLTFAVDPLADMLSEEITRKRYGAEAFKRGDKLVIDTTGIEHFNVLDKAEKIDKLIACGAYSIDEVRRKAGDIELGTSDSKKHWITKNYTNLEGGEKTEADVGN